MDIDGTEKTEGKVCTKCGEWKPLEEFYRNKNYKDGRSHHCKVCHKQYTAKSEEKIEKRKKYMNEYNKHYRKANKEKMRERQKQWRLNNAEHIKEHRKEYYEANKEQILERFKQHKRKNREFFKEYERRRYNERKKENIQNIKNILKQINSIFKEKDLPIYGYVYKIENIKTGRVYIGQTIKPLKGRYGSDIIKGWIKDRSHYENQKFKEELIEDDFILTDVLDVGCCKYHLDKLEVYWIDYYDSCNNGYNNTPGNFKTSDGIEEFNQMLSDCNLEFIDGRLIKKEKRLPKQA